MVLNDETALIGSKQVGLKYMEPLRISLRDLLFIVFFKIYVVIGVFFLIVAITAAYAFSAKSVYSASAKVLIKPFIDSRQQIYLKDRFDVYPVTLQDINTEIKIFTSRELALNVIQKLNLGEKKMSPFQQDELVSYVRDGLDVSPVAASNAIVIEKKGNDPEIITEILNSYLDCYIDRHIEVYKSQSEARFYKKQIDLQERELDSLRKELRRKEDEWSIINIEEQNNENIGLLRTVKRMLAEIEGDIAERKKKIYRLKKSMSPDGKLFALSIEFREDDVLSELAKAYIPLLVEQQKIIDLYPKNSIERSEIDRQVIYLRDKILQHQKMMIAGMGVDLEALEAKKKFLDKYITELTAEARYLAEKKLEQEDLLARLELHMDTYKLYIGRLEQARINEERQISGVANVSILSRAYQPVIPIFPKKKFMLAVSIIAGSVAGLGAGFVAYYLDYTVKEPKDLEKLTQAPFLSSLENVKCRI